MSIADEVAAATGPHRTTCGVCDFIESRPVEEQSEWDAELAKPRKYAGHTAIYKVMAAHGFAAKSDNSIINHRNSHHREH